MRIVCAPQQVNLFDEDIRRDAPRCNVLWWTDDKDHNEWHIYNSMRTYLNKPLLDTLKNFGSPQYSEINLHLLKDLYRALLREEPTKGFTDRLKKCGRHIEYWQWDIFEQLRWRASKGVHPKVALEDMLKLHYRRIEREDVYERWDSQEIKQEWREVRMQVLEAYKAQCAICNRTPQQHGVVVHVDHIIPKSHKPNLALCFSNLQVLCEDCNMGKGNKFDTDWRPVVTNHISVHEHLQY